MIESLLVANRGEIARRIIRTAKRLGIRTVAVYSEVDAGLPFVTEADEAVADRAGQPGAESYRNAEAILAAAKATGAAGDPPRLRLPVARTPTSPVRSSRRADLGRARRRRDHRDGRQDQRPQPDGRGRRAGRAGHRRPGRRPSTRRSPRRPRHRLPGDGQGRRRRRRDGHGRRPPTRPALRTEYEKVRGVRRADVRRRLGAARAVLPAGPPRRGADPRPGRRPGGRAGRAGVLGAAPQPEGGRGDAVPGRRRRTCGSGCCAAAVRAGEAVGLPQRRHGRVPARPAPPASSSSWR